jgi:hypothetical protein
MSCSGGCGRLSSFMPGQCILMQSRLSTQLTIIRTLPVTPACCRPVALSLPPPHFLTQDTFMAGFELIIFDCDGVLVDSEIIAAQVESKLLRDAGYPISAEELAERFAGLTWKDILFEVEREASIPFSATLLDALGNAARQETGKRKCAPLMVLRRRSPASPAALRVLELILAPAEGDARAHRTRQAVRRPCLFGQGRRRRPHQTCAGRVSSWRQHSSTPIRPMCW